MLFLLNKYWRRLCNMFNNYANLGTMMNKMTCCNSPEWETKADMGRQDACDLMLGRCINCGAYWLNIFQDAGGYTEYWPITDDEAQTMISLPSGSSEEKVYMEVWSHDHLESP